MVSFTGNAGLYTIKTNKQEGGTSIVLKWATGDVSVHCSKDNVVTLDTCGFNKQYVNINVDNRLKGIIYLCPDKNLNINVDFQEKTFTCSGDLSDINNYLLNTTWQSPSFTHASRNEKGYIQLCDSILSANIRNLENRKLPYLFTEEERQRLKYLSFAGLTSYPKYHKILNKLTTFVPDSCFFEKMHEMLRFDNSLLNNGDYANFIVNGIQCLCSLRNETLDDNSFIEYVDSHDMDDTIRQYVVHNYFLNTIGSTGRDGRERLIEYHRKHVTEPNKVKNFDDIISRWDAICTGRPSPDFVCSNALGNVITIESLRGKIIYIDIWATWCGPCRKELPFFRQLEKRYKDKGICFISLSIDKEKRSWENFIRNNENSKYNLYIGNEDPFLDKYMIKSIPRFILIDDKGRIITPVAPRPSDSKTMEIFDMLLSKHHDDDHTLRNTMEMEKQK
ncbi:MAG: TlpA family protein disulfide reductase [Prevotella sp.]